MRARCDDDVDGCREKEKRETQPTETHEQQPEEVDQEEKQSRKKDRALESSMSKRRHSMRGKIYCARVLSLVANKKQRTIN